MDTLQKTLFILYVAFSLISLILLIYLFPYEALLTFFIILFFLILG